MSTPFVAHRAQVWSLGSMTSHRSCTLYLPFLCPRIEPPPGCDYGPWPYTPLAFKWMRVPSPKSRPFDTALIHNREQLIRMQPDQLLLEIPGIVITIFISMKKFTFNTMRNCQARLERSPEAHHGPHLMRKILNFVAAWCQHFFVTIFLRSQNTVSLLIWRLSLIISYCDRANSVHIHQVEKMLEKKFGDFLFDSLPDKSRTCPR
ncbi:hypothetical protein CMV_017078 [Castanea mollissima]|uniref:Uncharacterized protein n=1 Tax=Castanea mollissima TaxID=60419 RepID=A0A8J4VE22_9ROSI|nr:hypothetical protein CMV_017078 [Castanea mollissima]